MRIFISGPMTGKPKYNYPAFYAAARKLRAEGWFVVNPAELSRVFGTAEEIGASFEAWRNRPTMRMNCFLDDWHTYEKKAVLAQSLMDADIAAMRSCDAIYLLQGWEKSRGARKELAAAIANGLEIMQEVF